MSRVSTPFSDAGEDAYLPSIEHDNDIYGRYEDLLNGHDTPAYSSTFNRDVLHDLNLGLDDGTIAPKNSRAGSGTATPEYGEDVSSPELDFSAYDFEQNQPDVHMYPGPDELHGGTQPYPFQLQPPQALYQKTEQRALPYRSATNTDMGYAPGPVQNFQQRHQPAHRRSWSQNDTDRIANLHHNQYPLGARHQPVYPHSHSQPSTNPTFVRLCETRHPRSTSKVSSEYNKRHHSQGRPGNRGRAYPPTSMPVGIGTPLSSEVRIVPSAGNIQLSGPRMMHMSHAEQFRTSQKIIEVGAMAVVNKVIARDRLGAIDPRLLVEGARKRDKSDAPSPETLTGGNNPKGKMLEHLAAMEKTWREGDGDEADSAKKACGIIREALAKLENGDDGGGGPQDNRYVPLQNSEKDYSDSKVRFGVTPQATKDDTHASSPASSDGDSPLSDGDEDFIRKMMETSPSQEL